MPMINHSFNLLQVSLFYLSFIYIINFSSLNFFNVSYFFGNDVLSYFMILLSFWISALMFLASFKVYKMKNFHSLFSFMIIILLLSLIFTFSSMNLFVFYIFFEVSMIPLLILIIGWGYQPERLMAGIYLIFYTMFFSLPMMMGLFFLYSNFMSFMFFEFFVVDNYLLYFFINFIFFVKIPMFLIHLWLPKAHVEAPVSGSMILAGIMLKLGSYGMIRLMKIFLSFSFNLNMFFINFSLIGGLIVSLICLYQTDIKSLIAYSSVSHMSIIMSSILTLNVSGFVGSLILMLAHGLCSSGLFCMANIYYERFNTRSMYLIKGLLNVFPSLSLFMFLLSINNMASPPSLNFLGEILLLKCLISYNFILMMVLFLISFFGAVYSIYLYSFTNHGKISFSIYSVYSGLNREFLVLFLHWFPLNVMIIGSEYFNYI
uniref:NADH dehydrogenase subunit 4 n=1 Tax=Basiprionota bisignata TaxID=2873934 RepID=UPI001F135BCB|nr:NADH dehydrogenase subunit 4 [Basiprionota bisignata]UKS07047.1 NADH dehydrogenase subunit 4 [Basiprionota bisignata]